MVDIEQYNLTKYGKVMFKITMAWTHFICKHKKLYYILTWTWGILMSLVGGVVSLYLSMKGRIKDTYYWIGAYKVGKNEYWGGCSLGCIYLRDFGTSSDSLNYHEFGHTMQNTLFGPFALFLCFIPSMFRYLKFRSNDKKGIPNKPYSNIWFEASATECGKYLVEYLEENKDAK